MKKIAKVRRINPTPLQFAGVFVTTTAVAALLVYEGLEVRRPLPSVLPGLPCDPTPYEVDLAELRAIVEKAVDEGGNDKAIVATNIASDVFGTHPTGAAVSFPPAADPMLGVGCVWQLVLTIVDAVFYERGMPDAPPPTGSLQWRIRKSNDLGYPWEEPVIHPTNWPSPGMFVDMNNHDGSWKPSNGLDSMIRAWLGTALVLAGMDVGIATSSEGQELRKQLRAALMTVGGYNDLLFGQTNLNYAGGNDPNKPGGNPNKQKSGTYVLNAQGRGLNWRPVHRNLKQAIQNGDVLKRSTNIAGEKIANSGGNRQMLVWLGALDLDELRQMRIAFRRWSDGSSAINPPPQIMALGFDLSGVVLPGVDSNSPVGGFAP